MIYITNKKLPDNFRNDNGLNLCKLWFYTFLGNDIDKNTIKKFDENCIILNEVNPYKLVENEIILIGNTYCVGDGYGNIKYCPYRKNEDTENYKKGNLRISKKYEVVWKKQKEEN